MAILLVLPVIATAYAYRVGLRPEQMPFMIGSMLFCIFSALLLWVSIQFTQITLHLEENTRLTRAACMRIADLMSKHESATSE